MHSKPYKVPAQNYSDLFNEFTVMSSGYFLFLFTDYIDDPVMSDHAGWALVGLLAFNIIINGIQIIIMTGSIDAVDAVKARSVGADDYCAKTSDCAPLIEAVKKLL